MRFARRLARTVLLASGLAMATTSALAGAYVVKSALGINLMAGHSPLHGVLYPLAKSLRGQIF